jgi:hypothetical protein
MIISLIELELQMPISIKILENIFSLKLKKRGYIKKIIICWENELFLVLKSATNGYTGFECNYSFLCKSKHFLHPSWNINFL